MLPSLQAIAAVCEGQQVLGWAETLRFPGMSKRSSLLPGMEEAAFVW
jgi:hypothetical protein